MIWTYHLEYYLKNNPKYKKIKRVVNLITNKSKLRLFSSKLYKTLLSVDNCGLLIMQKF